MRANRSAAVMIVLLCTAAAAQNPPSPEQQKQEAERQFEAAAKAKPPVQVSLQKLIGDLDAVAAELEAVRVMGMEVQALSDALAQKARDMKASGKFAKELDPVFDRLARMFENIPNRYYSAYSPRQALLSTAGQLRFDAAEAKDAPDLLERLDQSLDFPLEPEGPDQKGLLPTGMTLQQFLKKGPIRIFLMKHRLAVPKEYTPWTPQEIHEGKSLLGVGVVVRGTVTWSRTAIDLDQTWDIPPLHLEITPETRLFRGLKAPKPGDFVEIRGWTYYDSFHKAEEEHEQGELGRRRPSLWEIHPVTKVTILKAGGG